MSFSCFVRIIAFEMLRRRLLLFSAFYCQLIYDDALFGQFMAFDILWIGIFFPQNHSNLILNLISYLLFNNFYSYSSARKRERKFFITLCYEKKNGNKFKATNFFYSHRRLYKKRNINIQRMFCWVL